MHRKPQNDLNAPRSTRPQHIFAAHETPITLAQRFLATLANWVRFVFLSTSAQQRRLNRLAFRATIKSLRRELREVSGRALRRQFGHERNWSRLEPAEIRSVVICRINGRLGNTLLLTPLIKQIREWLPDATIDLALAYPRAEELLRGMPGIGRIITFPYRIPRVIWAYLPAIYRLRAQRYDLAIDPIPDSTSGRMAIALCRARFRLGFDTTSQWVRLTHPVALPDQTLHDGARPMYLLAQGLGIVNEPGTPRLWLPLAVRELDAGRAAVEQAVASVKPAGAAMHVFGFFAHAAGTKAIERDWWRGFWQAFLELEPDTVPVEFLPLSGCNPIDGRFPILHVRSPRDMVAAIAATRMFISPDTGPMHLASATEVPTVALFCNSNVARYHPMKSRDICIDVTTCEPGSAAQLCQRRWREERVPHAERAQNH
jgi:ADP-heptose:LPS heptosyltransferase